MPTHYDAIVIGTGQAGPSLAARLAKAGRRTAVLERRRFGGTCVNVGCIPTKTLVANARAIHMARRGAEFGFTTGGDVRVDMSRVKARKDAVVRQSNEGVERWMKSTAGLTVYEGHGRFTGPHTVEVNDNVLQADEIFINVGARAAVPNMPGVRDVPFLTNAGILELDVVPEHLTVVGGSYIGLEFAQMYRRFGSRVTVVEGYGRCWSGSKSYGTGSESRVSCVRGCFTVRGSRYGPSVGRGRSPAVSLDAPAGFCTTCGERRLGIWSELGYPSVWRCS